MIFDTLANCERYYGINKKFEKAFDFIRKATNENFPVGKYDIDGSELYASIQEYTTISKQESMFEGHRNYIDIQYIVSGVEIIEVFDISKAILKTEYDWEKDIGFFENNNNKTVESIIESGEYGIFFANDIHKPGISLKDESDVVKKIVVKVKI